MAPPSPLSKHQTQPPLRQLAAEKLHGKGSNPSQLGDPVSLKAETSNSWPTGREFGPRGSGTPWFHLSNSARRTMLGDPISLKVETVDTEPVDHDNGPSGSAGSVQRKPKL